MSDTVRFTAVTPNLIVRDVARSTAFYCDVLGFTIKDTVPPAVPVVMPLLTQPYGMREFAVHDPDGHLITFAERVAAA